MYVVAFNLAVVYVTIWCICLKIGIMINYLCNVAITIPTTLVKQIVKVRGPIYEFCWISSFPMSLILTCL